MTHPQLRTGSGTRLAAGALALITGLFILAATVCELPWWQAPAATATFALGVLAHETGHGLAATARGLHWTGLIFGAPGGGLAAAEITDPDHNPRTNLDQLLISISGPLTEILCGALVWALFGGLDPDSFLVGVAGACSVLDGAMQLLLVPVRISDGHKAATAAWRCLHHQAHHTWARP